MPVSPASRRRLVATVPAALLVLAAAPAGAQAAPPPGGPAAQPSGLPPVQAPTGSGAIDWLRRMHEAARTTEYVGTFVVSTGAGALSSARIWHACDGPVCIERVETLSGPQRSTFRRNELVRTFLPDQRLVKTEQRENLDVFPNLLGATEGSITEFYDARPLGRGRVAGIEADLVQIVARDAMRFGYRVWCERRSGLVLKLQTLDARGAVVEQSAFSELQFEEPMPVPALAEMMDNTQGWKTERSKLESVNVDAEGWTLSQPVPGFKPVSSYLRPIGEPRFFFGPRKRILQWTFSDGLATVSLFLEPYGDLPRQEGSQAQGATYTLSRKLPDAAGDWWLTAVGEVPMRTLDAFARALARTR